MRSPALGTDDTSFSSYVEGLRRIPLLTSEEERALAERFRKTGDTRAAHRLVEANLRFVVKIAFEFRRYGMRIPDLVQEGNLGLMRAVQKFEPARGYRLLTYAAHWIRAHMRAHVMRSWSLVRMGQTRAERQLFFALSRAQAEVARLAPEIAQALGEDENARLAAHLAVDEAEVASMRARLGARDASLDAPLRDDDERSPHDLLADEGEGADDALGAEELRAALGARLDDALRRLDPREREVVTRRFLVEDEPESLTEIAASLGLSRERVRQLELRALEKVRVRLRRIAAQLEYPGARRNRPLYVRALVKGPRRPRRPAAARVDAPVA
jgi:RNA polymerase sigma-32 factor